MKYILQVPGALKIGGVEKVSKDLGVYSDKSQYETHYLVFGKQIGEYEKEVEECGCKVIHIAEPSDDYFQFIRQLIKIMKETKYYVVHAHTMFNIGLIMVVARFMGVPVRIAHAHSALNNGNGIKKAIYESCMKISIRLCSTDYVACGEKAGIRLFGKALFYKKGKTILNGIDINQFRFNLAKREEIRSILKLQDKYVIGHVGHMIEVKNQKYLVNLLPEILKYKENAVLLLLGDGTDKNMLQLLSEELEISNKVFMTGNVENVYDYLNAMDVFAFPSLYEGMPLSIIEVQANGLPCVMSLDVPQDVILTDLINQVSLTDRQRWAEDLCELKRNEKRDYATELIQNGFDLKTMMKELFELYEE